MRVTVEWSSGRVEELDVHRDFAELLDKIGKPLTIQTYMKVVWDINIPTNVQVPADLQEVFENFFCCSNPRPTWPSKSHEKSLNEIIVIYEWYSWQRVLVALNEIASTVDQWDRALTAAVRIPETNFVAEKLIRNAAGGSKQRKKNVHQDILRRIRKALDAGVRDKRKLTKIYGDSFAKEKNKPVGRAALSRHLKDILDESAP